MGEYANDDQMVSVAHSCRRYNPLRAKGTGAYALEEDLSCSSCKSWNGSRCVKNKYDRVLSIIDH